MYIYRYHITTNIGTVLNNHISAPRVYPLCVAMRRRWPWGRLYRWPRVFSKQCRSYTESVPGAGGVPYSVCMYVYIYIYIRPKSWEYFMLYNQLVLGVGSSHA